MPLLPKKQWRLALRYFEKDPQYEGHPLKESTVYTWVSVYKNYLQQKASELPGHRRGHPLLLSPCKTRY